MSSPSLAANKNGLMIVIAYDDNKLSSLFSRFFTKTKKSIVDPQREWLKNELKDFIFDTFNSMEFKNNYYFNQANVIKSYNKFIKTQNATSFGLFQILSAFRFQRKFSKNFMPIKKCIQIAIF